MCTGVQVPAGMGGFRPHGARGVSGRSVWTPWPQADLRRLHGGFAFCVRRASSRMSPQGTGGITFWVGAGAGSLLTPQPTPEAAEEPLLPAGSLQSSLLGNPNFVLTLEMPRGIATVSHPAFIEGCLQSCETINW